MTDLSQQAPVGLIKRFTCMFYDGVLLIAVLFFASILVAVPFEITQEHPLYPLYGLYVYGVGFVFYAWCWIHGGQTLGLKTWRLKITMNDGSQVTWKAAFLRYLGSILCWLSVGIGFLWCYTNKDRRAWNDLISNTYIARCPKPQ